MKRIHSVGKEGADLLLNCQTAFIVEIREAICTIREMIYLHVQELASYQSYLPHSITGAPKGVQRSYKRCAHFWQFPKHFKSMVNQAYDKMMATLKSMAKLLFCEVNSVIQKNYIAAPLPYLKTAVSIFLSALELFHKFYRTNRKSPLLDFEETWFSAPNCCQCCIWPSCMHNRCFLSRKCTLEFSLFSNFRCSEPEELLVCPKFLFFSQQTLESSQHISSRKT